MAAQPIYIETEEEIPEVIERVRRTASDDVPLVLPSRSRFGQSRFNFQLLREYARGMGKQVSIVSPDPAVQQMAEENGFRVFRAVELIGAAEPGPGPSPAAATAAAPVATLERPPVDLPPARAAAAAAPPPRLIVKPPSKAPSRLATEARPGRLLLYTGAGLLLVAGMVAGALYVPAATVTVRADATPFAADMQVDAAPGQPPVKVRTVSVTRQASTVTQATGVKTTPGTVASGAIVYINNCNNALGFINGSKISGAGQQFALVGGNDDVPVPGGGTAKGVLVAAKSTSAPAGIKSLSPSAAANVGAGAITTIDNSGGLGCVTVNNPAATSGGTDEKKEKQIQTSDVENARSALDAQLRKDIGDELARQSQAGEKLADAKVQYSPPDFGTDQPVGTVASGFNATMKLTAEGAYYSPDDVQRAMIDLLTKKVPAGKQLTDNRVKTTYDIVNAGMGGHLTFRGNASSYIAPSLDRDKLKGQLAARPVGGAQSQLKRLPIRSASIKQSPVALPLMPLSPSRITVVYEIDQVAGPTPSPAAPQLTGRVLAVDPGSRRVGLALSDPTRTIATPLDSLAAEPLDTLAARIAEVAREREAARVVVGLPLRMDGSSGPEAAAARRLADGVRRRAGIPVTMLDERLSSAAAERALLAGDVSRRRRRLLSDRVAATIILQSYLDSEAARRAR